MFTANLPVCLTAVSNSSERLRQHRTLGGSAVSDVTAVAVTPRGPSGPAPEMMLTPPASRRIANLKSSPLIVESLSNVAVACICSPLLGGVDIESALAVTRLVASASVGCGHGVNRFGDEMPTWGEKTNHARRTGPSALASPRLSATRFPLRGRKITPLGLTPVDLR